MTSFRLAELAERLGCGLHGDGDRIITGVSTLEKASVSELSFLANLKYAPKLKQTRAAAVLATEPLATIDGATLISSNPYLDFARALSFFYQPPKPAAGVHATAIIAPGARVGTHASIGPYAVIGENVTVGDHAVLHPHVVLYDGCTIGDEFVAHSHATVREFCRIGNRVTLHNGVVIGGDGFGFAKRADGSHYKIVQSGVTVIEDDVEVQTLTSVDRATMGETRVKRGTKIDSLVQVGHACLVGEDCILCAQTGLAGSTTLEDDVVMAGQTGAAGHLTIRQGATIYAQAGVGGDVPAQAVYGGSPAFNAHDWVIASAATRRLPKTVKTIRDLERRIRELEKQTGVRGEETS